MGSPDAGEVPAGVNRRWTDTASAHDERGLKHRPATETRQVPIPAELVAILRQHIDTFGVAPDGRIFSSDRGHPVASTAISDVWAASGRFGRDRSRIYPTTSGIRPLLLASCCIAWMRARDAVASLNWRFVWWQVQGSNLGRRSRRFYSTLLPAPPYTI